MTDVSLDTVLEELRTFWNEEEGPQTFVITGEDGSTLAVVFRDVEDAEVAHTVFASGNRVSHRCTYILDVDGTYDFTHVQELDVGRCWKETRGLPSCNSHPHHRN